MTRNSDRIPNTDDEPCHDCECGPGELHDPGCDDERCAECGGQAISCECEHHGDGNSSDLARAAEHEANMIEFMQLMQLGMEFEL